MDQNKLNNTYQKLARTLPPEVIEEYRQFAHDRLHLRFRDISLLIAALTHRSYINEHKAPKHAHNERLEFLGDAVLELVVSDFLYRNYEYPEGTMTAWRSALVRTEANSAAGRAIGYEPLIMLSRGESRGTERAHASIIADCYEALIGAIYLDQGYDAARDLIHQYTTPNIEQIIDEGSWRDPKSLLQEISQHIDEHVPVYRTLKEEGPDHDKNFTVGTYVNEILKGTGSGHSKQEAQTNAATEAIKSYRESHPEETLRVTRSFIPRHR